ncbi:GntR family transcriptional regulator [Pararhizobium antarcticum]|uniref:HTH gntR-type domain-containing protein n=1 Tax=Pararhizobium antarcticum TaxID=1798805 RepID=A0A657LLJ9_9HYPH|nr:GntR family transcriptional regulator [Pararhizobium antarcticum]OJF90285.1 hypothetical protein AX760_24285 [Pararhizobium antarcticum]
MRSDPTASVILFPGEVIDRSERASPQILQLLRSAIIDFRLEPNQPISENEVAEALGVSRTPVREAFLRLAEEGLLLPYPQLGTFVAPISRAALLQAQFLREAVECAMARRAAEMCTGEGALRLKHLLERHQAALDNGDTEAFYRLDELTHHEICLQSGNPDIWGAVAQARGHLDRARRLSLPDDRSSTRVLAQHAEVIEAISTRNGAAAEASMRRHLVSLIDIMDDLEARYSQYFKLDISGPQPRRQRRS